MSICVINFNKTINLLPILLYIRFIIQWYNIFNYVLIDNYYIIIKKFLVSFGVLKQKL